MVEQGPRFGDSRHILNLYPDVPMPHRREAVLFANEAFYLAFNNRDLMAMADLWSSQHPVACIHPGWDQLRGRHDVLASWEAILEGGKAPDVKCRGADVHFYGTLAVVVCYEVIEDMVLVATNIFVEEDASWKMVQHQASPCQNPPDDLGEERSDGEPTLQ